MTGSPVASQEEPMVALKRQLGEKLRAARESHDLSISHIADRLKVSEKQLETFESGSWQSSLDDIYLFGFLRQFALSLDMDISQDIADLQSEEYRLTRPFTIPDPPVSPGNRLALGAAIVFAFLFVFFNINDRTVNDVVEAVRVGSPAVVATPVDRRDTDRDVSSDHDQEVMHAEVAVAGADVFSSEGEQQHEENDTGMQEARAEIEEGRVASLLSVEEAKTVEVIEIEPEEIEISHHYRISAVSHAAWLRISEPDGALVRDALLQPGDTLNIHHSANYLLLTCGNAGAVRVEIDQIVLSRAGSLGELGEVVKAYKLQPQQ